MNRYLLNVLACVLVVITVQRQATGTSSSAVILLQSSDGSSSHRFEEIADGVYFAIGTGSMTVMSNNLVIINDDHVMLVDSSVTPAAARGLIEGIRTLTDKPIKYVFNTHYHFDHAHGNQIFEDDVEIIGHDFVRTMLSSDVLAQRTNRSFTQGIPDEIEQMKTRIGQTSDPGERRRMETQLEIQEAHWGAIQETVPTSPNVTYSDTMTLVKGGREVQLHFPGLGHTGGDTLVFLPEERIVFTGDFLVGSPEGSRLPYMGDGYVEEWPASLDRLRALDFDVIVPGHGTPFRDRGQIDNLQAYLRDLNHQVSELYARGVSPQEAVKQIDLSAHVENFGPRVIQLDPRAVIRMYERLQVKMPK